MYKNALKFKTDRFGRLKCNYLAQITIIVLLPHE